MLSASRAITFFVFGLLGLSFIAGTAVLIWEFNDAGWFTIATHDSHLFLFFPTLGLVALAAFYVPALAFVDMYWREYVPYGRLRFAAGFMTLMIVSWLIASTLSASPFRPIWDIAPSVLLADKAEPSGCGQPPAKPCERIGLLDSLENVRQVSQTHLGLSDFVRKCTADPLIEDVDTVDPKRFCFASSPLSSAPVLSTTLQCCKAQERFKQRISDLMAEPSQHSYTGMVHALLLPLKVMFLLLLGIISVLLAARYRAVAFHYPGDIARIDLGVIVGAFAMLMFPLMSQGFVQTSDALFGTAQHAGFKPIVNFMTGLFAIWALLLLIFFYHRHDRELEIFGKLAGVLASVIAVFKYDLMVSLVTRYLGSGAGWITVAALVLLSFAGAAALLSRSARRVFEAKDMPPA